MKKDFCAASVLFSVVLPLGIIVHECGHWLAAIYCGWEAELTPVKVIGHYEKFDKGAFLLFLIGGPIVDISAISIGLTMFRNIRGKLKDDVPLLKYWLATALTLPAMRWLVAPFVGSVSDEAQISSSLGMHELALPMMTLVPGLMIVAFVVRLHWRNQTMLPLTVGFVSGMLGAGIWAKVVGPRLL